jgi:ferrous-iron efflux pump FieF
MNQSYGRLVSRAAIAATVMASSLLLIKIFAWWYTGSVSILAALVDSLMDIAASLTNLLVVRYSLQPADEEHTFGHGKAESLAALAQSMFISGSALFLFLTGIQHLLADTDERSRRGRSCDDRCAYMHTCSGNVPALGCSQNAKSGRTGGYASLSI